MTHVLLLAIFTIHPLKPDHTIRAKNISLSQTVAAAKTLGVPLPVTDLQGRISTVLIEVRPYYTLGRIDGIYILGDPVRWIRAVYSHSTREYDLKSEALGGLIELNGILPKLK